MKKLIARLSIATMALTGGGVVATATPTVVEAGAADNCSQWTNYGIWYAYCTSGYGIYREIVSCNGNVYVYGRWVSPGYDHSEAHCPNYGHVWNHWIQKAG